MKPGFLELNNGKIVLPLIKKVPGDDQTTRTSSPFVLGGSPLHTDLFPLRTSYQFNTPNLRLEFLRIPRTNSRGLTFVVPPSQTPFKCHMIPNSFPICYLGTMYQQIKVNYRIS